MDFEGNIEFLKNIFVKSYGILSMYPEDMWDDMKSLSRSDSVGSFIKNTVVGNKYEKRLLHNYMKISLAFFFIFNILLLSILILLAILVTISLFSILLNTVIFMKNFV
jgi:hypothetical protein